MDSNHIILTPFNENGDVIIQADASNNGMEVVIYFKIIKIISFASRSLSNEEKQYGQIEKEFLAIVFTCKRYYNKRNDITVDGKLILIN